MNTIKKYKIALVGACDRYNYGDILLPKIVREIIVRKIGSYIESMNFFALINKDLTSIGGDKIRSLRYINSEYDIIIVVGGEVLSARYNNMYRNLFQSSCKLLDLSILQPFLDLYAKKFFGGKYVQPWMFYPTGMQKIIYIAVGGILSTKYNPILTRAWCKCIDGSAFFSVRSDKDYSYICDLGTFNSCRLIPDTAMLASEYIAEGDLEKKCSTHIKSFVENTNKYWVFQINKRHGNGKEIEISDVINECRKIGVCVLLPIGLAFGHDDMIPLGKIKNYLNERSCKSILINNHSIYDIIYLIKNCQFFIGTSLHGIVTAASYEIPHALFCQDTKVNNYLQTWNTTKVKNFSNMSEFKNFILRSDKKETLDVDNIRIIKAEVTRQFDSILKCIMGG